MNRLILLLIVWANLMGCQQRDIASKSQANLYIDNQKQSLINHAVASSTCNNLFINSIDFNNNSPLYSLEINLLKTGKIVNVKLVNKERIRYETQLFDPAKYISIRNFVYDSLAKLVSFDLTGKLFIPQTLNSINVNAEFKEIAVESAICTETENRLQGIIQSQSAIYRSETTFSSTVKKDNLYYQYFYLTDNFRIVFQSSSDFKTIPVGTYPINSDSTFPFNISFQEYIGLSIPNNFNVYMEKEWQNFNVEGRVTIQDHITIKNKIFTYGTLQFEAANSSQNLKYEFRNGSFIFYNL